MKPPLSLKGRALQLLAQREHSRLELRGKLLRRLRDDEFFDKSGDKSGDTGGDQRVDHRSGADGAERVDAVDRRAERQTERRAEVEAVLDWLQAHRHLSDERFVESRVHARSARFGNRRIHQELSQHGVALTPAASNELRDSEKARASQVRRRKFGELPTTATDRARQARFLAGRGFSSEVVWQVLREVVDGDMG